MASYPPPPFSRISHLPLDPDLPRATAPLPPPPPRPPQATAPLPPIPPRPPRSTAPLPPLPPRPPRATAPLPPRPPHPVPKVKPHERRRRPTAPHTVGNGEAQTSSKKKTGKAQTSSKRKTGKAQVVRMQDPRGDDFAAAKSHSKKVVYRPLPSGQLKAETELLRRDIPHSSGKIQKPPKRSFNGEPRLPMPYSDRGTPGSLPDSDPTDEYRALRRKYLMLEEENLMLDNELSMEDEEIKALEDEKSALLDQLVVLEGLVDPPPQQSQRRL
ncbi:hypothetical protein ACP70R_029768 [Stipagrostis hirtigluma subsp. patula]